MKKTLLIAVLFLLSCGGGKEKKNNKLGFDEVYVCGGIYAKRYHNDEYCKGLQSCRGGIEIMTIEEAEDLGKTPCGYCY